MFFIFFFFNVTAPTEIYTLSLHDALPILQIPKGLGAGAKGALRHDPLAAAQCFGHVVVDSGENIALTRYAEQVRSEEHTSELQSRLHLVCRLLLEKKKTNTNS